MWDEIVFAADWLGQKRLPDGRWDMGRDVNEKGYFPLSDSWRRDEERLNDCTARVGALIAKLCQP